MCRSLGENFPVESDNLHEATERSLASACAVQSPPCVGRQSGHRGQSETRRDAMAGEVDRGFRSALRRHINAAADG